MEMETVLYEVTDHVALVTLNRPEQLNSWTPRLADELSLAMGAADADESVRAVVVTGAGRAFCAGADLSGGEGGFAPGATDQDARPRLMPHKVRKPVIAAINGHAVGVGITYPMLCDIRIAAEDAKIQFAMVRRGILPELGSHVILPRVVGFSKAAQMLLTGAMLSGQEAAGIGLVSEAAPADEVVGIAMTIARDIATNVAPVSAALSKQLLWSGLTSGLDEMIRVEGAIIADMATSPDATEGVRAFFERREPKWTMTLAEDLARYQG